MLFVIHLPAISLKNVSGTKHYLDVNVAFKGVNKIGCSMTFQAKNSDLRNYISFRHQRNKKHHQGTSPFTELNIDMIKGNYYVIYHYIGNRNMNILCNIDINSSTDK
jgi:hypothetical protein